MKIWIVTFFIFLWQAALAATPCTPQAGAPGGQFTDPVVSITAFQLKETIDKKHFRIENTNRLVIFDTSAEKVLRAILKHYAIQDLVGCHIQVSRASVFVYAPGIACARGDFGDYACEAIIDKSGDLVSAFPKVKSPRPRLGAGNASLALHILNKSPVIPKNPKF